MVDSVHDVEIDSDVDPIDLTVYPQSAIKTQACSQIPYNGTLVSDVDITVECSGKADEMDCTLIWGISDDGYYSSSRSDFYENCKLEKTTGNLYKVKDKNGRKPELSFFDYECSGTNQWKKQFSDFKNGSFSLSWLPALPFAPILRFDDRAHDSDVVEYDYSYGVDIEFVKDSLKVGGVVTITPNIPNAFNECNYKIEIMEINSTVDKESAAGETHPVLEWLIRNWIFEVNINKISAVNMNNLAFYENRFHS